MARCDRIPPNDINQLIELGRKYLIDSFKNASSKYSANTLHIVPLSGGLDSRVVLKVLESVEKDQILTLTFGTPAQWIIKLVRKSKKRQK